MVINLNFKLSNYKSFSSLNILKYPYSVTMCDLKFNAIQTQDINNNMPLHFGLPISVLEACRLLGIDFARMEDDPFRRYHMEEKISKILKDDLSSDLKLYPTRKDQCILGYVIYEAMDVWDNFCSPDDLIVLLLKFKRKFAAEITRLGIDLSCITLQPMEGEERIVSYPEPFVMSWP